MTGRHHSSRSARDDPRVDSRGMRDPRDPRDTRDSRDPRDQPRPARGNDYFVSGDGIEREVIQNDICRYLGRDALVRPINYQGRQGYLVTAYRNLTSEMMDSLKNDSAKFVAENRANRAAGYRPVSYDQSDTFADSYDEDRSRRGGAPSSAQNYSAYPGARGQYDEPRGESPQYYPAGSQAPPQPMSGHSQGYVLNTQAQEYGAPQRRDYPQGSTGQYYSDPRQDPYQPRTTQGPDEGLSRGGVYVSSNGAQYPDVPSNRVPTSSGTYMVDQRTGQTVYVDPAYDVPRRTNQPSRPSERDHRRMR